jgi:hypothetical protein
MYHVGFVLPMDDLSVPASACEGSSAVVDSVSAVVEVVLILAAESFESM